MTGHSDEPEQPMLDARDGYRIELTETPGQPSKIYLELFAGGKTVEEPRLLTQSFGDPTWQEKAVFRRKAALLRALCRNLNAGGYPDEVTSLATQLFSAVSRAPRVSLPDNLQLLDVLEDTTYQMLLVDEATEEVTIVTEDQWVDRTSLSYLASRLPGVPVEKPNDALPTLE